MVSRIESKLFHLEASMARFCHKEDVICQKTESAPMLSIISICRNEKYMAETCESIVNQSWKGFEWIVVDGGSCSEHLSVLNQYKSYMKHFVSEPDTGRYHAMNKGIALAKGEYLLFLNGGDEIFQPTTLENIFLYQTHPLIPAPNFGADIWYGEVVAKENGMMPWPLWSVGPQTWNLERFDKGSLPHQATFIRRELFSKCGLYDETLKSAGDFEWFMRVILKYKATYAYIPTIVARYNFEGMSSMDEIAQAEGRRVGCYYYELYSGV